jgi:hypothetical protein
MISFYEKPVFEKIHTFEIHMKVGGGVYLTDMNN